MMMMKREREVDSRTMASYLMLLSRGSEILQASSSSSNSQRVFECKTCNRQFSSFQALGGHRASHKKPRLMADGSSSEEQLLLLDGSPPKPKTHECSICGLEFAIGQALGGHMRRHRATTSSLTTNTNTNTNTNTTVSGSGSATTTSAAPSSTTTFHHPHSSSSQKHPTTSAKRKRSPSSPSSSSSVLFLDLNLTPFENDLEFLKIGQPTTTSTLLDCFN